MPPKCAKCGCKYMGDVCPQCGHDRRPDRVRIHWQICPTCRWCTQVDGRYLCRRFPPTIIRAGRYDYPEVDDQTIVCAEWDDGRHDPRIMRKRKEEK